MTRPVQAQVARVQRTRILVVFLSALSLFTLSLLAQPATKRPLAHTDYDTWRAIQLQQLSRDGKLVAYALNPEDADGEVVARVLASGVEWRHPRGHRPDAPPATPSDNEAADCQLGAFDQPPTADCEPLTAHSLEDQGRGGGRGGAGAGAATGASGLAFTADSRFLVFQVFPTKAEGDAARKENRRAADMPQNAMGVMDLTTGKVDRTDRVRRFSVPEQGSGVLAYLLEAKPEPASDQGTRAEGAGGANPPATGGGAQAGRQGGRGGAGRQGGAGAGRRTPARPEYGTDLVVRNLTDKTEKTIADVLDFSFSKDGKSLTYTVSSRKPETNGVYRQAIGAADGPQAILTGRGKYTRLTWDEKETQLIFLSDRDEAAARQPKQKIFYWNGQGTAVELVNSDQAATASKGMVIAERAGLTFSQDGTKVFLGVAPAGEAPPEAGGEEAAPAQAASATPDEDTVSADLWHWKDDFIQPMQKVRATQERNRTYRAVFHINEKKLVQLADPTMADVNTTADGRWGLGSDDRRYRTLVGYDTTYNDHYLVNTSDGTRKLLLTKQQGGVSSSPNGKYALYFDGKNWNSISIPDGKSVNLTKDLGVNFWNETNDTPGGGGAYPGSGVWTKDEKSVLLCDRYDIWQVAPDGSGAKNLTDGVGRKEKLVFRVVRVDSQERQGAGIDPAQPLLLSAENESTHDTGFYRDRIDGGLPQKLIMAAKRFTAPMKAKDADVYMLTASTFNEFPDLQVSGPNFTDMKKVSNANPQKTQISWGTAELVRFKNSDGVPLSATLFKPENFDPSKKYPMMVYIYELLSNNVNNFVNPGPGTSINIAYYVSNGYLVLTPDIVYTVGHPGQSALKCVLPAIQSIVDKGFVDEKAIGIQGHSWGGYQIAYMITQTNRFRAVEAGAPVSNMTSAYSGIRWGTGLPRQFQYEKTQSRIGVPLFDNPMLYIENSPVFHAARVQTPILILHNDADDAVPWYQGIEYYLALRRLGKEAYMFTYNGEPHGLRRRADMKDYTVRMQQFFDHFLKGAPTPEWMEKGIPYLDREKEKEKIKAIYQVKPAITTDRQ